jgi:hypothetical protein
LCKIETMQCKAGVSLYHSLLDKQSKKNEFFHLSA